MTILNQIKEYKLKEIIADKQKNTLKDLEQMIHQKTMPRGFLKALLEKQKQEKIGLIAEIKKASPSKGLIRADFDVEKIAQAYQQGGAACVSILTDAPSFQGHNDFLEIGRQAINLPLLRKDFMFDPYQIIQSRALGADCVLLIMACLDNQQAIELEQVAHDLQMDVLIETHNSQELERALTFLKSDLIGINNRNLHNFETDISISETLVQQIPQSKLCVSESGIFTKDDILRLKHSQIQTFLIGESLMRQDDIVTATKAITNL